MFTHLSSRRVYRAELPNNKKTSITIATRLTKSLRQSERERYILTRLIRQTLHVPESKQNVLIFRKICNHAQFPLFCPLLRYRLQKRNANVSYIQSNITQNEPYILLTSKMRLEHAVFGWTIYHHSENNHQHNKNLLRISIRHLSRKQTQRPHSSATAGAAAADRSYPL